MRLNASLARTMNAPELQERLATLATEPVTSTPEEFGELIKRETAKWGQVVRDAGLQAD
jgi:tripartite-type tricarboxylate transporter receptor subunit TctC